MVQYLPLYSKEQARRHEVRPGISGWAQCHGRNSLSWSEKFALDVWYVDHCTLMTDIKIVLITIKKCWYVMEFRKRVMPRWNLLMEITNVFIWSKWSRQGDY